MKLAAYVFLRFLNCWQMDLGEVSKFAIDFVTYSLI